jgi:hypothetical protein
MNFVGTQHSVHCTIFESKGQHSDWHKKNSINIYKMLEQWRLPHVETTTGEHKIIASYCLINLNLVIPFES